jgi:hypothetical protein
VTKPRKRQRAECLGFCQLRSLGAKEAPVADKRISKMREGKALISAALVAAFVAFSFPLTLWAGDQAGRHHLRHRGGAVWKGSVARARAPRGFSATEGDARPWSNSRPYNYGPGDVYGFGAAPSSITNFPYGNPYSRGSGGCCHGRN